MTGPVDIREPFYDLCGRLGLDADDVQQFIVFPRERTAAVYIVHNDDGVSEVRVFDATTDPESPSYGTFNPWVTAPREDRKGWGT